MKSGRMPSYYVGIGASAGGLEAIEKLFQNVPIQTGLAFIVIQHLSPDYKSMMVELLSKKTRLPVLRAEDGMLVDRDSIYLIPPKKNLTIFHGKLLLSDRPPNDPWINLPIDIFFRSLAEDQGEKAVGIILSGTGSDGTRGIRAIKENGGLIMVQDEKDAKFDGMPKSATSTGLADFILNVEDIPEKLMAYIKYPYLTKAEQQDKIVHSDDSMATIFSMLRSKTKIDFTYYKPSTVVRRIERRMNVNQVDDLQAYIKLLKYNNRELTTLYHEMLIGVTSFFRDREAFDYLAEDILPQLLESKKGRLLRIWSVGCSTGEEAYSLAILLQELLEKLNIERKVKIFATDVDSNALQIAGGGTYPESIAADVGPSLLSKYFQRQEDHYRVSRKIREMVVFAQHNIISDPPFTKIDIISCRNLLIYLQPMLQQKALSMFNFSLNIGGILFLGSSETTGEMSSFFSAKHRKWKIYSSKSKQRALTSRSLPNLSFSSNNPLVHLPIAAKQRTSGPTNRDLHIIDRLLKVLAKKVIPLAIVVNDELEVLYTIGDVDNFLSLPSGMMKNDIRKMLRNEIAIPVTIGIQKAFKEEKEITYSNIGYHNERGNKVLKVDITPLPGNKIQSPLVAILFNEITDPSGSPPSHHDTTYDYDKEAEQRLLDLEQELQFTKENLQATIEELETSNEELQATNEELLASNEELQSTNEELQSVNEELYTVNSEHQIKIMELTELNNDMDNLLDSSEIGTIFLDDQLNIRKFSPQIKQIFNLIPSDLGRPFDHLTHRLKDQDILELIKRVLTTSKMIDRNVQSIDGKWFLMRILPYNVAPNTFAGVVITLVEVSDLVQTEKALEDSEARLGLAEKTVPFASWQWNIETGFLSFTASLEKLLDRDLQSLNHSYEALLECVHPDDSVNVIQKVTSAVERGVNYEVLHRILRPNGAVRHMKQIGVASLGDNGKATKMTGILLDITEEKKQSKAEKEDATDPRRIEGGMNEGLIVIEQSGKILSVNSAVVDYFGFSYSELIGSNVSILMAEPHKSNHDKYLKEYLKTGKTTIIGSSRQLTARHKDGSIVNIKLSVGEIKIGKRTLFSGVIQVPSRSAQ
ncbi:chemotaxis protein CheB [Desulfopila aestuarii]|nr:chemotaxis protein CheB [Desulfopila aestuarii]